MPHLCMLTEADRTSGVVVVRVGPEWRVAGKAFVNHGRCAPAEDEQVRRV